MKVNIKDVKDYLKSGRASDYMVKMAILGRKDKFYHTDFPLAQYIVNTYSNGKKDHDYEGILTRAIEDLTPELLKKPEVKKKGFFASLLSK